MKITLPKLSALKFHAVIALTITCVAHLCTGPLQLAAAEVEWNNTGTNYRWTTSGSNWWSSSGSAVTTFSTGDAVVFGATDVGNISHATSGTIAISSTNGVTIGTSGTNPGMFVTGTGNWVFVMSTGSSANTGIGISGSDAGVLMQGTGTLTFSTTTAYTGATEIAAGTLRLGAANAIAQSSGVTLSSTATLLLGGLNQTLKTLTVSSGANIVFGEDGSNYSTLTLNTLSGTGGNFTLRTNFQADASDTIVITGSSAGAHTLVLKNTGGAPEAGASMLLVKMSSPGAIFSGSTEIGANTYEVQQGVNGSWYLFEGDLPSRTAAAVIASAAAAGQDWHYEMDALYKRMGELREPPLGGSGNLWLRANATRVNVDADLTGYKYHQYAYGATIGADKALHIGQASVFIGGFGAMSRVDRDFKSGGDTDTDTAGGGLYVTWQHATGWFADVVGRMDRNKNEINAMTVDGYVSNAKYDSDVKGVSVEFGHRLLLNEEWWIEPGLQYAFANIDGADYETTSANQPPMPVHVEDSRASQSRLSLRFGEAGGDNPGWHPYAKLAAVYSWTNGGRVRAGTRDFEADFDGWRYEIGFGAAYAINARSQFYYDYEYAWSPNYSRPWSVNLGYRLAW